MDDLLQKYNDFMRLNNCRAEYLLSNGQTIDFVYKEENFIHLLGLHKLIDIQLIQLFNDKTNKMVQTKYIISRIKKGKLTDAMVRASVFYNDISERYENFSYDKKCVIFCMLCQSKRLVCLSAGGSFYRLFFPVLEK